MSWRIAVLWFVVIMTGSRVAHSCAATVAQRLWQMQVLLIVEHVH